VTDELRAKLGGRRVVASVSGGKDSAAMSLWLMEQGIEHDRVFLDTGWEHRDTYDYLRGDLTRVIGPIIELRGDRLMVDLIRKKGIFPRRTVRFCTQELKVRPMQRYLRGLVDAGAELVNAVGIRRAESLARSKMTEWEWSDGFDCEVWRPLIAWTEAQVIEIHTRHGLRPNPIYLRGATRVGCWPCIFARKDEIRTVADTDPGRIDQIRDLETEMGDRMRARAKEKGAECPNPPTFFQGQGRDSSTGARRMVGEERGAQVGVSIDDVVKWSRTLRGGRVEDRQIELLPVADEGCMRWGLCETAPETPAREPDKGKS
jgi:3'-phosphoadenosine 5'-phosphosulfate sulfotransferase (PAPS reductase)/FAD synthetase